MSARRASTGSDASTDSSTSVDRAGTPSSLSTSSSQELVIIPTDAANSHPLDTSSLHSVSSDESSQTSPFARVEHPTRNASTADHPVTDALLSPTMTSSSRTPSSGFMDDDTGLSDVSSLDNDDFELVERSDRPSHGANLVDSYMGSSSVSHPWASNEDLTIQTTPLPILSTSASAAWSEVDALETRLEHTHELFRERKDPDASQDIGTPVGTSSTFPDSAHPATRSDFLRSSSNATLLVNALERAAKSTHPFEAASLNTSTLLPSEDTSRLMDGRHFQFPDPTLLHQLGQKSPAVVAGAGIDNDSDETSERLAEAAGSQWRSSSENSSPGVLAARLKMARSLIGAVTHSASSINVFYLGRDPGATYSQLVSNTIKTSAMTAVAAADEKDFTSMRQTSSSPLTFHTVPSDEGGQGNVMVRCSSVDFVSGRTLQVKEFFCLRSLSFEPGEEAQMHSWLQVDGAMHLLDGSGLVVCFLENGESQQSLAIDLAALLHKHYSRARLGKDSQAATRSHPQPHLLPIVAPKLASNLDDADTPSASLLVSPQRDENISSARAFTENNIAQNLGRFLQLRRISEEWSSALDRTRQLLAERSGADVTRGSGFQPCTFGHDLKDFSTYLNRAASYRQWKGLATHRR
ncbi:hypothetical protein CBOM_06455 [Ceraceosorus bombacis]|uniref:Uncharacterized protein n=1 Tax=Ceraceosorus bombacis TaxID=401625 RepID=A0A0N7LAG4_9BASI|nr:hypothetical protein CBOM_06455 [Ceraceosorus bombacis]